MNSKPLVQEMFKKLLLMLTVVLIILALIIIPFLLFGQKLDSLALIWVGLEKNPVSTSLVITALLASDVVLPIPSSLVAASSGSILGIFWGTIANWAGLIFGSIVGYYVGFFGIKLAGGLKIVQELQEQARQLSDQYGVAAIAICRPVPVLAEASAIYLGLSRMDLRKYLMVSAASNFAIALLYAGAGAWAAWLGSPMMLILASIMVPLVFWVFFRILRFI